MDDDLFIHEIPEGFAMSVDERAREAPVAYPGIGGRARGGGAVVFAPGWAEEVARHVSALRRRLREVEAERDHLETLLSLHPDPVLVIDQRREIVRGNAAALRLFGADIQGRDWTCAMPDQDIRAAVNRVLNGGAAESVDFRLARPADRYFRTHITRVPELADHGPMAMMTITDLTEVKRAAQIRADFVANASHELRTPLSILLGFIETLTGSAADDPDARRRFLPIMGEQAARMARLVDDLLSLSCIELTEHAPPTGRVELPGMLKTIVEAFELRARARGMRFELAIEDDVPPVLGDPVELAQVFQNIIDNAIKYAHPNTAIVVEARVSAKFQNGVAVMVRDHGAGIAEQHLSRLTERFYRVDVARSCEVGGTGLGLAIVKHVLNRHRGILEIDSRIGEGSTFTVHLGGAGALQPAEPGAPKPPAQSDGDRPGDWKRAHQRNPRRAGRLGAPAPEGRFNRDRAAR
jgi:two-component system phosphate regulon sensor histidine kinase PhoR